MMTGILVRKPVRLPATQRNPLLLLRSFGIFLKWLSDRSCPVYVVATANNIRALPVEFTRKGRFDELYGVYLPTHAERQDIFGIHLRLRKREPEQFDLDALARKTEGYTGADIKEVVQLGLKLAFRTPTCRSIRNAECRRRVRGLAISY